MNLEYNDLFGGISIVEIHDNFIGICGLDVANMTDPLGIVGPSKILESLIWDPSPISYYLQGLGIRKNG